jgi:hypothetical protein
MKKRYTPKEGVKVRDLQTGGHFPPEGSVRIVNSYLTRRVNDGDLIAGPVKVKKAPVKKDKDSKNEGVK